MKRILIAVDGSPAADEALSLGMNLGRCMGSEIVLLHADAGVAQALFDEDPQAGPTPSRIRAADPVLDAAARKVEEAGLPLSVELVGEKSVDAVADAIVGAAAGLDVDLVVVGSRGHGALATVVLGSVSHGVLRYAKQPVVVVHAPAGD